MERYVFTAKRKQKITVDTRTTSNTCLRSKLNLHSGTIFNFTQYNIHFIWVVRVCILRRHISCYIPLCYKHSSTAEFRSLHLNNDIARVRYACRVRVRAYCEAILATQSRSADLFHEQTAGEIGYSTSSVVVVTHTHARTCWCYSIRVLTRDAIKTSSPLCLDEMRKGGFRVVASGVWHAHTAQRC